jgi:ribosomal protein L44E
MKRRKAEWAAERSAEAAQNDLLQEEQASSSEESSSASDTAAADGASRVKKHRSKKPVLLADESSSSDDVSSDVAGGTRRRGKKKKKGKQQQIVYRCAVCKKVRFVKLCWLVIYALSFVVLPLCMLILVTLLCWLRLCITVLECVNSSTVCSFETMRFVNASTISCLLLLLLAVLYCAYSGRYSNAAAVAY